MTPQDVVAMFDSACADLDINRKAHVQIQQIILAIRRQIESEAKEESPEPKAKPAAKK